MTPSEERSAPLSAPSSRDKIPVQPWTPQAVLHLRWYAERGLSLHETAKLMDRTMQSVADKAHRLQIKFHGPSGAPFLNSNRTGRGGRLSSGRKFRIIASAKYAPRDERREYRVRLERARKMGFDSVRAYKKWMKEKKR